VFLAEYLMHTWTFKKELVLVQWFFFVQHIKHQGQTQHLELNNQPFMKMKSVEVGER